MFDGMGEGQQQRQARNDSNYPEDGPGDDGPRPGITRRASMIRHGKEKVEHDIKLQAVAQQRWQMEDSLTMQQQQIAAYNAQQAERQREIEEYNKEVVARQKEQFKKYRQDSRRLWKSRQNPLP